MEPPVKDIEPESDRPTTDGPANEALLARLEQGVKARGRARNVLKVIYGGGLISVVATNLYVFSRGYPFGSWLVPLYLLCSCMVFLIYPLNFAFYRSAVPRLKDTIILLAQRGEERAVGPLLELMDVRISGIGGWGSSRPLFVQAMSTLLSGLTLDSFQQLTAAQIHQLTPLLMFPEPELKAATREMFVRCGDARALRALQRFQALYKLQRVQRWNPAMKGMIKLLNSLKAPVLDSDAIEAVDQCCNAIQVRLVAESSSVQLLRASAGVANAAQEQLLRATWSTRMNVPPAELVRAVEHSHVGHSKSEQTTKPPVAEPITVENVPPAIVTAPLTGDTPVEVIVSRTV